MKFERKALILAISAALGSGSGLSMAADKPNIKVFPLSDSTGINESGIGRRIATDGAGKFLAVWLDSEAKTIYGRYTANGFVLGADAFVIGQLGTHSGSETRLSLAMKSGGDAVTCWSDGEDNDQDAATLPDTSIVCQLIPANNTAPLSTPLTVNAQPINASSSLHGPSVAIDDSGKFIVVWQGYDAVHQTSPIYARRFNAAGTPETAEFEVSADSSDSLIDESPSVAVERDVTGGDAVIAWTKDKHIFARRIHGNGSMDTVVPVDQTPADDTNLNDDGKSVEYTNAKPAVAMDDTGSFAVVWQRQQHDGILKKGKTSYTDSSGIFAQRFNASDSVQNSGDVAVQYKNKQLHINPDIVMDSSGNFVVVWQQDNSKTTCYAYDDGSSYCYSYLKGNNIFAAKYNPAKNKMDGAKSVVKTSKTSKLNTNPSVALDDSGNFEVLLTGSAKQIFTDPLYGDTYYYNIGKTMAKLFPGSK